MTTLIDLGKLRFNFDGVYSSATQYELNDCVTYGGNVYAYTNTVASTGNLPTNTTYWTLMVQGFAWVGNWATATPYKINDIVFSGISSYLVVADYTSGVSVAADIATGNLVYFAKGAADILPSYTSANAGQSLSVNSNGTAIAWKGATASTYNLYVSPTGSDVNDGKNINNAFASIQAAVAAVPSGNKTTIHVQAGIYSELLLPIVVPPYCAIVGDASRTTIIQPGSGLAADGVTPNNQATMWALSNGSLLNKMSFQGMTGWVPGTTPADITTSTPKGIYCALNPASPITIKSPYVIECSAFSSGGIGAYVNGSVHTTGNRSILFHEYTGIHDNGIGLWIDNNGKAEAVGVFTYYCYFGYATTNGGQIRSISGNNSYGTYGAFSSGYSASETPTTGKLYGTLITLTAAYTGTINVGDTVTSSSGATATVVNVQVQSLYVTSVTGTFASGNTLTTTSGGTAVVSSYGGQQGYVLVMNNLSALPLIGQSVQIAGDSSAYIISNVSGTYSGLGSVISVVVAQQIPTAETNLANVTIRSNFSLNRITAHDFLYVGTGGITTTNYPGTPTQQPNPANQTIQTLPGRVYSVSADQAGNFQVGAYFAVNQATGAATLNANSFNLSGLTSLRLGSIGAQLGAQINEFSTDGTMSQNSPVKVPTQSAVVTYVQANTNTITGAAILQAQTGTAYTFQYSTFSNQGLGTITWSLTGTVPSGVSVNSSTGVVNFTTGVSTGTYSFTIQAVFATTGTVLTKVISATVNPAVPVFASNTLPTTTLVAPSSSFTNSSTSVTVGSGTPSYAITAGALPSWVTLGASTGLLTGTAPSTTQATATYSFTVTATNGSYIASKAFTWTFQVNYPVGQALYGTNVGYGTFSWVAPSGVTSVSVVAIGGGQGGAYQWSYGGGGGGGLGWKNNITVTPGTTYTVVVGAPGPRGYANNPSYGTQGGTSYFISTGTVAGYGAEQGGPNAISTGSAWGGGYTGDGGGRGGNSDSSWTSPGSGAGGYGSYGGDGNGYASYGGSAGAAGSGSYYSSSYGTGAGGGVGLNGQGLANNGSSVAYQYIPFVGYYNAHSSYGGGGCGSSSGTNGYYGENPFTSYPQSAGNILGGTYGGGGGGSGSVSTSYGGGNGGQGGVRIIWGPGRSFPSTLTADQPTVP